MSRFPMKAPQEKPQKKKPGAKGPWKYKDPAKNPYLNRSYTRGPYKQKSTSSSIGKSVQIPTRRGPKKKVGDQSSIPKKPVGPRRGPHTIQALHRDYEHLYGRDSQSAPRELCYTCEFELDRLGGEQGEEVIRCSRCNECDIHRSCFRNCRKCEELDLI